MEEALNIFFQIYSRFISLLFNDLVIESGVTVGWVLVVVFVFGIMLRNIVALPSRSPRVGHGRGDDNN